MEKYEINITTLEDGNAMCSFIVDGEDLSFEKLPIEQQKTLATIMSRCTQVFISEAFCDKKFVS